MKAPALPVAIALLFILPSCKKDDGAPLVTTTYSKTGKVQTSNTRVFALSGEITTPSIINRFNDADGGIFESIGNQLFPYLGTADKLKVHDEQSIEVFEFSEFHPYHVSRSGNHLTLTAGDTTKVSSVNEVFTRTVFYNISYYKPYVFSETLVSSVRGLYIFEYTTLKQYHLEAEQSGIRMPWLVGMIHNANGSTNPMMIQNKIDTDFYKKLSVGDTVVVQTYDLLYEK